MGASAAAPQYLGIIILIIIAYYDFHIVQYIPKMIFSSLLVLSGLDLFSNWFIKSFQRTDNTFEWIVTPLIMTFSYVIGLLSAVALGVGISVFIFVAAFYRSGVLKFVGSGLNVRSTIERMDSDCNWLDENGDYIQILILQNYIFFGNASSCQNYIHSMFEEVTNTTAHQAIIDFTLIPPIPKFIIMDFSLVTGVDTSAVDIFSEILILCKEHQCKFYLTGLSNSVRDVFLRGGLSSSSQNAQNISYEHRMFNYFPELDSALGIAEDLLLSELHKSDQQHQKYYMDMGQQYQQEQPSHEKTSSSHDLIDDDNDEDDGFFVALHQIDELVSMPLCITIVFWQTIALYLTRKTIYLLQKYVLLHSIEHILHINFIL